MKHILACMGISGALLTPFFAFADPVIRSGEIVSVSADQVIEGDFYALGGDVTISGEAQNDVYVMGGTVTVNAPVGGDLVVLGGTVQVHAPIGDDVRALGGKVIIGSSVGGDVGMIGGELDILSTGSVAGDVLYMGGRLDVGGPVTGGVLGQGDSMRINAPVGKDVSVSVASLLAIGDKARIEGDVRYKSADDLQRSPNAVIVGDVRKEAVVLEQVDSPFSMLLPVLTLVFASLTMFMLFRPSLQSLTDRVHSSYGVLGLLGLGVLFGLPFMSVVLMASLIGTLVGLALFLLYFVLILLSIAVTGSIFGTLLLKPFTKSDSVTLLGTLVGSLIYMLLFFVPLIGPLLIFASLCIAMGAVSKELYSMFR